MASWRFALSRWFAEYYVHVVTQRLSMKRQQAIATFYQKGGPLEDHDPELLIAYPRRHLAVLTRLRCPNKRLS
jgi:hypothetical protein